MAEACAASRTAAWVDHWIGYRERFDSVLPDELWVADEHAAALARRTVPGPEIKVVGNPISTKAALKLIGHDVGGVRLPLVEATPGEIAQIRAALERGGVLEPSRA